MKTNRFILFFIGISTFAISSVESIRFAKERIAFGDAAFQLFTILRTEDLAIQVMRFGSALTQGVPLLMSKLHLSLLNIMFSYSLSFESISLVAFLIIVLYFKNIELAIVLVLLKTLITTHTFFWVQSELLQGLVIIPLCIAWMKGKYITHFKNTQFVLLFVFVFTLAFFHPLIVFPFSFCIIYLLFFKSDGFDKRLLHLSLVLFFTISIIKTMLIKNAYDSSAMAGLDNFKRYFPHYLNIPVNRQFLSLCLEEYYFIPILLFFNSIILVSKKKWTPLFFATLFLGVYFLIVQITDFNGGIFHFRIESFYIPLAFMLSFVFVLEASTSPSFQKIVIPLLCVSLVMFVIRIEKVSTIYSSQLHWNRTFLTEHMNEKLVVRTSDLPRDTLLLPWALPYQTWMLSTIENHKTVSIAVSDDPHSFDWTLWNSKAFITAWGIFDYHQLASPYFQFKDDTIGYKHYDKLLR